MDKQERRGWLIVASLFTGLLTVYGATTDSFGVFFMPLVREFGWSHARVSILAAAMSTSPVVAMPLAGWLLDRIEARFLIGTGILIIGLSLLCVSQVHSFGLLLLLFLLIGVGLAFSGFMAVSVVVANWFTERRGTATGIALAGSSIGGSVMIIVAKYAMSFGGWRMGYILLSLPMFLISAPLVFLTVRTRPGSSTAGVSGSAAHLTGMDFRAALKLRAVWFIGYAQFVGFLVAGAVYFHLVPYLVSRHQSERYAAILLGITSALIGVGKIAGGPTADFFSDRLSAVGVYLLDILLLLLLINAPDSKVLTTIALCGIGLTSGASITLTPILLARSVGLRRFGSISGIVWLVGTAGLAIGPIFAGRIFDVAGDYVYVFKVLIPICALAAIGIFSLKTRNDEPSIVPVAQVEAGN